MSSRRMEMSEFHSTVNSRTFKTRDGRVLTQCGPILQRQRATHHYISSLAPGQLSGKAWGRGVTAPSWPVIAVWKVNIKLREILEVESITSQQFLPNKQQTNHSVRRTSRFERDLPSQTRFLLFCCLTGLGNFYSVCSLCSTASLKWLFGLESNTRSTNKFFNGFWA